MEFGQTIETKSTKKKRRHRKRKKRMPVERNEEERKRKVEEIFCIEPEETLNPPLDLLKDFQNQTTKKRKNSDWEKKKSKKEFHHKQNQKENFTSSVVESSDIELEILPNFDLETLSETSPNMESVTISEPITLENLPNMEFDEDDCLLHLDLNKLPDDIYGDEDDEWSAETILDQHEINGVLEYLVKWKGNPVEPETWIASTYLTKKLKMVEEFDLKKTKNPEKEILHLNFSSDSMPKKEISENNNFPNLEPEKKIPKMEIPLTTTKKKKRKRKQINFFSTDLKTPQKPTIPDLHNQFQTQGLCQLQHGIKKKYISKITEILMEKFTQTVHTINVLDLQKDLEDTGFVEFKTRSHGRYDMMIKMEEFSFFRGKPPWLPLVCSILGNSATLTYVGCIFSLPGSMTQPFHSDGEHLSETEILPPHCLNVFVPLVDFTPFNGPTEFIPTSHVDWNTDVDSVVVLVKAGSALLFDYRLKHRGLGNNHKTIRPLLYFTYAQPHFVSDANFSQKRYLELPKLLDMNKNGRYERARKRAMRNEK